MLLWGERCMPCIEGMRQGVIKLGSNSDAVTNSLTRPMHAKQAQTSTAEVHKCMTLDTVQAEAAKCRWPVCLQPVLTPCCPTGSRAGSADNDKNEIVFQLMRS